MRPVCSACNQRPLAVNYHKDGVTHYRTRCGVCIRKGRRIKVAKPRWELSGYKKKPVCERCGFRTRFAAQSLVFHIDGNLNNSSPRNLKTVCLNCVEEIKRSDLPWKPGDLEPDY
jgi:hypothetical protein